MPSTTVAVGSRVGLHLRPAQLIAEAVAEHGVAVRIGRPGEQAVDAASALHIMTLGAGAGETLEVSGDDQAAVDAVAAIVAGDAEA